MNFASSNKMSRAEPRLGSYSAAVVLVQPLELPGNQCMGYRQPRAGIEVFVRTEKGPHAMYPVALSRIVFVPRISSTLLGQ